MKDAKVWKNVGSCRVAPPFYFLFTLWLPYETRQHCPTYWREEGNWRDLTLEKP